MTNPPITTVSLSSRSVNRSPRDRVTAQPSAASSQARPVVWLGARSAFGLSLPDAKPTSSQLYAPRGVWMDEERLIVCDSGNHRVLIWNNVPSCDAQPADLVLGQIDFDTEGPAQGCASYERGLHLPTAAIVAQGKLLIADAWHHRVLVWNEMPTQSNQPADYAIGQSSLSEVQPNRGTAVDAHTLVWPYGLAMIGDRFYVADTGNRRVLGWNGIPKADEPAVLVLGQPDARTNSENRGGPVSACSFRWPHAIAGDAQQLWIADAGNHRVLGWDHHPTEDCEASWLIGQSDMTSSTENPYTSQNERVLRFPYGLAMQGQKLIVADTANNRVMVWSMPIDQPSFAGAVDVIGQPDFEQFGENHWQSVTERSLCWPYGVAVCGQQLAVADSGNNRVMIWNCPELL